VCPPGHGYLSCAGIYHCEIASRTAIILYSHDQSSSAAIWYISMFNTQIAEAEGGAPVNGEGNTRFGSYRLQCNIHLSGSDWVKCCREWRRVAPCMTWPRTTQESSTRARDLQLFIALDLGLNPSQLRLLPYLLYTAIQGAFNTSAHTKAD